MLSSVVEYVTRNHKLSTTLTEEEKTNFRILAAEENMNMSEYLREIVYDELEEQGHETSRGD